MTVHLLDSNVLIALAWPHHVHHRQAHRWFQDTGAQGFATCPITQLAFTRISSNRKIIADAVSPREALAMLERITALPNHHCWMDAPPPVTTPMLRSLVLIGHRQLTDAYLLTLAQHFDGRLATFDSGLAQLIPIESDRARWISVIS